MFWANTAAALAYTLKAVAILQKLFPNGHPNLDVMKRNLEKLGGRDQGAGARKKIEGEKVRKNRKSGRAEKGRREEEKKKPPWCYFVSWCLGGKVFEVCPFN